MGAHAPGLKHIEDALEIRRKILTAFERAEAAGSNTERTALLTFLIVGGGPTGVELAGAIAELSRFGMDKEFRQFDPADARVVLVQSAPRLLPAFPESLAAIAQRSLEKLGVEVLLGSRVEAIDADGQVQAVRELQKRDDPKIPALLAGIMRTDTLIGARKAVAQAFESLPCDPLCSAALLHYLERINQGELNVEDTGASYYQSDLNEYVKAENRAEQQEIYGLIYSALLRNSKTTNAILSDEYGLGSHSPKDFGIDFAMQSNDRESCPALEESASEMERDPKSSSANIRKKLHHAITALQCPKFGSAGGD